MTIPKLASGLDSTDDTAEYQAFLEETRDLFGDEAAEELAERIKAQRQEEDEPV